MAFLSCSRTHWHIGYIAVAVLGLASAPSYAELIEIPGFSVSLDVPATWHSRMTSMPMPGRPAKPQFLLEALHASDDEGVFCQVMSAGYAHPVTDEDIRQAQILDETKQKILVNTMSQAMGIALVVENTSRSSLGSVPALKVSFSGAKVIESGPACFVMQLLAGSTHVQSVSMQCAAASRGGPERAAAVLKAASPALDTLFSSVRFEATQAQDGGI